jgi:hypothetical protein
MTDMGTTRPGPRPRWLGVGSADALDAGQAARRALASALRGDDPKLFVVFASRAFDLRRLLAEINAAAPGVPLIGCSTAGEISASGRGESSVVLTAFGGPGFTAATRAARGASARLRDAGREAASCIGAVGDARHRVLIMLTDSLSGDQQEIVRGAYSVVGAGVPLVGGCAGDDLEMRETYQLHGDEVLSDGVAFAALGSDAPIGIGVRHGWRRVGEPMLITRSIGNRVIEIDDGPALDAYLDRLDAPAEARRDPAAFTRFAQTHPLGLSARRGEEHARFVGEGDFTERSLVCIAEVPQGGLAWLMEGDDRSVLDATDSACEAALAPLDGQAPIGLLAFDCIARRGVLGDSGSQREIDRLTAQAGGAPVAGFYTYGEIARTQGVSGFHNQTLVVMAVS